MKFTLPVRFFATALLTAGLCACSSAPMHFYTLVKPVAVQAQPTAAELQFEVLPVSVPAQVDIPQLVLRRGDSELALVENQQWIAPLGQEIRSAVAAELATQLGAQDFSGASHGKSSTLWSIRLDITRFESTLGNNVLIEALWSLRSPQGKLILSCNRRIEESVGNGYAAMVEGHQRALAQIAAGIADGIRTARASSSPRCPG